MEKIFQIREYIQKEEWINAKTFIEENDLILSKDREILEMAGLIYFKLYHFNTAETMFNELVKTSPNDISYYIKLAEIYIAKKFYTKAIESIKKSLEIDKNNLHANKLLYDVQQKTNTSFQTLKSQLEKIIKIEASEEVYFELCNLLYKNEKYEECVKVCGEILRRYRRGEIVQKTREIYNNAKKRAEAIKVKEEKQKIITEKINNLEKQEIKLPEELKPLEKFTGMEDIKKQVLQIYNMIKFEEKRKQQLGVKNTLNQGNHFIITGNPGTGKTTVAKALAEIFANIGLIKENKLIEADRKTLVGQHIGATEKNTQAKIEEALGGVLFIDEAYTLYRADSPRDFGKEAIEVLLSEMENRRGEFVVIVAGYKKEMDIFFESNPGLKGRFNYNIHIPDYTDEELVKIAEKFAYEKYYLISDGGKKALLEKINQERSEENFSNARLVRRLVGEAIQNFASRMINNSIDALNKEELIMLDTVDFNIEKSKSPEEEIESALKELNDLIGLKEVKEQVESVINRMKVHQQRKEAGLKCIEPSLHMMFIGNPGTGKTTVAKIIGRIYKALGVLRRGDRFEECTRTDFVGNHVGETAIKTQKLVKSALGGILFIDEAYSLYQGDKDNFGKEAIDVLIKEMEDHRDNLMVIMAGYEKEMEMLLSSNTGFKSRINTTINFYDYSNEELIEIFKKMCISSDMTIDKKGLEALEEYIDNLPNRRKEGFGNGREVRNIFEKVVQAQNNRIAKELSENKVLSKEDLMKIEVEDILSI